MSGLRLTPHQMHELDLDGTRLTTGVCAAIDAAKPRSHAHKLYDTVYSQTTTGSVKLALTVTLPAGECRHLRALFSTGKRSPICRQSTPTSGDDSIAQDSVAGDSDGAFKVCSTILELSARIGGTTIALGGPGRDLDQTEPLPTAADGQWVPCAFVPGKG